MQDLTVKYPAATEALREAFTDIFANQTDSFGLETEPHKVSAQSYDGFIAHTNGGWRMQVMQSLGGSYYDAGNAERDIIEPYYDSACRDAAEAFARDYQDGELYQMAVDAGRDDDLWEFLNERWFDAQQRCIHQPELFSGGGFRNTVEAAERDAYHDFQSEYLAEGGTYFTDITALFYEKDHHRNVTGVDEVYIFAGVNTDFEYGRENGLQCTYEETVPVSELSAEQIATLVQEAADSLC